MSAMAEQANDFEWSEETKARLWSLAREIDHEADIIEQAAEDAIKRMKVIRERDGDD